MPSTFGRGLFVVQGTKMFSFLMRMSYMPFLFLLGYF